MEKQITNYLLEWNFNLKKGRIVLFFEGTKEITPELNSESFQNIIQVLKKGNAFLKDGIFYNKFLKPSTKLQEFINQDINEIKL